MKSSLDSPWNASSMFAPIDVPARGTCFERTYSFRSTIRCRESLTTRRAKEYDLFLRMLLFTSFLLFFLSPQLHSIHLQHFFDFTVFGLQPFSDFTSFRHCKPPQTSPVSTSISGAHRRMCFLVAQCARAMALRHLPLFSLHSSLFCFTSHFSLLISHFSFLTSPVPFTLSIKISFRLASTFSNFEITAPLSISCRKSACGSVPLERWTMISSA